MKVYRITLAKYAGAPFASGNPARWNSKGIKAIYTASSRSLACLENVVHRTSKGLKDNFKTIVAEIPDGMTIEEIMVSALHPDWRQFSYYPYTQKLGDEWILRSTSAVLKVPAAIVPAEHNYILNPLHHDFKDIKYIGNESFDFDNRIKTEL